MLEEGPQGKKPGNVTLYYDAFAPTYDAYTREHDFLGVNDPVQRVFEFKQADTIETVLDLGAGTGQTIEAIKAGADPRRIVAVDVSPVMLDQLRRKNITGVEAVEAAIEDYVAGCQEQFDLITAVGSLEFVRNLPEVLQQAARLLKPGGVLAASYVPRAASGAESQVIDSPGLGQSITEHYWLPNDIKQSLVSQGLTIDEHFPFNPYARGEEVVTYNFIVAHKA